jgi:hypothetical protein
MFRLGDVARWLIVLPLATSSLRRRTFPTEAPPWNIQTERRTGCVLAELIAA